MTIELTVQEIQDLAYACNARYFDKLDDAKRSEDEEYFTTAKKERATAERYRQLEHKLNDLSIRS